jgi:hypothetical protein
VDRLQWDYLGTTWKFKEYYKKGIGVLKENRLGSINKEGLLKNKPPKGDLGGVTAELLRLVPCLGRELVLLLPSSYNPYSISFYSLE